MNLMRFRSKALSMFLAVLIAATGIFPAVSAFAADGVEGYYDLELFYKDTDTIVPSTMLNEKGEEVDYIEYMTEGDELALTYHLIDTEMPDNGYFKWFSETPSLVDVTQDGVVKAFDSSKGAVIQSWIDNEVKTIPLVGGLMAKAIEKALFNDYVDVDTMDTEEIINLVDKAFGEDSLLAKYIDSYKGELINSLREYLDNINSNIHIQLFSAEGKVLAEDVVRICVQKCTEWYANFLPNGTHITNKSQINTTVAVGSTAQLYAVTTPLRLHYGCIYSVKSTSIFNQGKVIATVNDSGLVTFKNKGTVTIIVSPDTEEIIEGILELVNYFYKLENTGTLDTDKIAGILIDYVGIDMNRTVLAGILDVCFAIADIAGDTADPVQLTATAVEILSNLILQFKYNDSITFNVVDSQPLTDFSIDGAKKVAEGSQIQLSIVDIQPSTGDVSDITWSSSDPTVASVDPKTGVITGRDSGGSLGSLSTKNCVIFAESAANNVVKSYEITVTGKTGNYISDVEISGPALVEMSNEADYTAAIYPARVSDSKNLYYDWGIKTGEDENGDPVYEYATDNNPATNGLGTITSTGHYTAINGGKVTICLNTRTGYYISNNKFYEISSFLRTFEITNGVPVESISINATSATSNGSLSNPKVVSVNGQEYTYYTVKKSIAEGYWGNGAKFEATIYPEGATNKNVRWVVDNSYYNTEISDDTHNITVKQVAGHEVADTFNIYAVSADGKIKSNTITVCVTRNPVTANVINNKNISVINGKTADATHTLSFDGSWDSTAYACFKCNWYSSDESIFTVQPKGNDNRDAVLRGMDVGVATLYCVSADGGIIDSSQVTVYPDKQYLQNIVNLCEKTIVKKTSLNRANYTEYMRNLDLAYSVLYDEPLASQDTCDSYGRQLLISFYKVGGFVGLNKVEILGSGKTALSSNFVTVNVGTAKNYKNYSYDFDFKVYPVAAMYDTVQWTSSDSSIAIDKNGICSPTSNDPCSAMITCTVTDYMGATYSDSVYVAFSKTAATGLELDTYSIEGGKIGNTQTIKATVLPGGVISASCSNVMWSTSDPSIATVDNNGVVTFVSGGNCVITCTAYDGGFTAQCTVNVITNYDNLQLLANQYTDLSLNPTSYYPDTWERFSTNLQAAKDMIAQGGYSQAEVDAMYDELHASYVALEKYNYLQKIELYLDGAQTKEFYQFDLSLLSEGLSYKNAILDLNVRLYPNNASYDRVIWTSSTEAISVDNEGNCSPTSNASCYGLITCTVIDHYGNEFSDSVWVSFAFTPVTGIELSETEIMGSIDDTHQLYCTILPTGWTSAHIGGASIRDYYWESDDESVATVDENGLITFVSAGSTIVRAVSYDGGISGECIVSTEGNRAALREAVERFSDIDYTQYEYSYAMTFKAAYDDAVAALTDVSLTQSMIDSRTETLIAAGEELVLHPFVPVDSIDISYAAYEKKAVGGDKLRDNGMIGSNDAVSINLSKSDYNKINYNNYLVMSATVLPANAMYEAVSWSVEDSKDMKSDISNTTITLTPKKTADGAWAIVKISAVDAYSRVVERTIVVTMSDNINKAFIITDADFTMYATDDSRQLNYALTDSAEFKKVIWSSDNPDAVTVNDNGVITPVEKGVAVITGRSVDGGFTDSVRIEVLTDFSALAAKQAEYQALVESVTDSYTYTQDSLDNLSEKIVDAQTMINAGRATQAEVNEMLSILDEAYNSLEKYVVATGVSIALAQEDDKVTVTDNKYFHYSDTTISNKSFKLSAVAEPEKGICTSIEWTSSNSNITVSQDGTVKNGALSGAGVSEITCTITNVLGETYSSSVYVIFARYSVTGISFENDLVYGAPAQKVKLTPTFANSGNSNIPTNYVTDCIYTSSDESIATVDNTGEVTFVSQGTATITAVSLDGGYTATINAYTTWDTTALKAAIEQASKLTYTDYEYSYGMNLKSSYDAAVEVYNNIYASQEEIDAACTALTEAMTDLEDHKFVTPVISIVNNGNVINTNARIETDSNSQAVIQAVLNDGAVVTSFDIEINSTSNATAVVNGSSIAITKTGDNASISLTVTVIDEYERVTSKQYTFGIIDALILATDITLTVNGNTVGETKAISCGGNYNNFAGVQIGFVTNPANANSVESVTYSLATASTVYFQISDTGMLTFKRVPTLGSSIDATVNVTVNNADGTVFTKSVKLTITKA